MPIGLGPFELLIILAIVMVVFGAGKLSQVGGALGQSFKDFKETVDGDDEGDAAQPAAVAAGTPRLPAAAERGPAQLLQREEI